MCPSHHIWKCCEQERYFVRIYAFTNSGKLCQYQDASHFFGSIGITLKKMVSKVSILVSKISVVYKSLGISLENFCLTKPQGRSRKFRSKKSPSLGINGNYGVVTQCWVALYFVVCLFKQLKSVK